MEWLTQYWPYLIAAVLLVVLVGRLVLFLLPRYREPTRHSGERTIRVVGVGGAGGNAVDHMIRAKQRGVDYIAVNTDAQVLEDSLAMRRVQIGAQLTQGLGAGGDATIGRQAAVEDAEELGRIVAGADLVFIAAGLGGGTGSGAAPVIAAQARQAGALTVGVVTRPFEFEGVGRRKIADTAWVELRANVDTLLVIENERVLSIVSEDTSMLDAFTVVNEVLAGTVRAIVDIMTVPGLINLDFADVRAIMQDGGMATAGIGAAVGPERAVAAAQAAVTNPLLNHDLAGAGAILLNVAGASGMTMREVKRAAEVVRSAADPDAMIIFGTIFDDHLDDELRVTVIATHLRDDFAYVHRAASDTPSIAETEEPAPPAAAVAAFAVAAVAVESEEESDVALEEEEPRWAAIPIVTEDQPVPVVASGGTAVAERNEIPEPFVPWVASQAYGARVEEAPAEESAAPSEEAIEPEPEPVTEPAPAEQSWSAPVDEAPEPELESEPAPAEQSWAAPVDEAPEPEPESELAPAEQSAPAEQAEAPGSERWAAATGLAATVFAQSEPAESVSELESAEEPADEQAPTEPVLTARPYEALGSERWAAEPEPEPAAEPAEQSAPAEQAEAPGSERWAAATGLAATVFAQSEPAELVSELESAEEPADEHAPTEPVLTARPYEALGSERWAAATVLAAETFAPSEPAETVSEPEAAEEAAPAEEPWSASADEAIAPEPEPASAERPWSASADETGVAEPEPEPALTGQSWFAEGDEAQEPAPAGQPWFATADVAEVPEPASDQPTWSAELDEAAEPTATEQPWVASTEEPTTAAWAATSEEAHEPEEAPQPDEAPEPEILGDRGRARASGARGRSSGA